MSLVAWYPLNKDFRNLGDSDFDITNTTNLPTINNNGKIGKTYHFSKTEYLTLNKGIVPSEEVDFSCCYWIKELSNNNVNYFRVVYECGDFIIGHYANKLDVYKTNGGIDRAVIVDTTSWVHCCVTFSKNKKLCLFINGELIKEEIVNELPNFGTTTIGKRTIGGTNDYIDFYINDFRLYDHVLSEAEIKEISKAKILHYNFESIYGMKNLLKNSKNERSGTCNGSNIFIDYDYSSELSTTTERTFTVSADVKGSINGLITDFYFRNTAGNLMNPETRIIPTTEYKRYTITLTLSDGQNISDFRIFRFRLQSNGTIYIKNVKLTYGNGDSLWSPNPEDSDYDSDVGNIVYDSSGYGHKGQLNGNAHYTTSSVFGNYSINFNGIGDFIDIGNYAPYWWTTGDKVPELTLSSWFKVDSNFDWSYSPNLIAFCGNAFIRYRLQSSTSLWAYGKTGDEETSINRGITKTCKNLQDEKWHNAIFTFKNGMAKLYLDGENIGESDWSSDNHTTLYCGSNNAWYVGTYFANSENFVGNIDDVRIYATALTDNDIKYLYNERVKIDSIGNTYCSELNEEERVVEYLESTGTQWIDTETPITGNTEFEIGLALTSSEPQRILGDQTPYIYLMLNYSGANTLDFRNTSSNVQTANTTINQNIKYIFEYKNNKIYQNKNLVLTSPKVITSGTGSMYLFCYRTTNGGTSTKSTGLQIYYFKVWENGELIRDFLPTISTEDGHIGEPCLFDTVENKYYYNQGTGTFLTNLSTSISNVNVTDKGILNCRYLIEGNDPAKVLKDENIVKVNEIKEN